MAYLRTLLAIVLVYSTLSYADVFVDPFISGQNSSFWQVAFMLLYFSALIELFKEGCRVLKVFSFLVLSMNLLKLMSLLALGDISLYITLDAAEHLLTMLSTGVFLFMFLFVFRKWGEPEDFFGTASINVSTDEQGAACD